MLNVASRLESAMQLHRAGQFDEAGRIYHEILKEDPRHPDALHLLGVICHQRGEHSTAIEWFEKAIAINATISDFHRHCGLAWHELRQFDRALECFKTALRLHPKNAETHNNMGHTYRDLGRLDEARTCYEKAVQLDPRSHGAHNNLGNIHQFQGRLEKAASCYRTALGIQPHFAEGYNNLGNILLYQGKPEEATAHYRKALEINPNYPEALLNLGTRYKDRGNLTEAAAYYQKSIEIRPRFTGGHSNLGEVYREQGRLPEAIQCFERAMECDPSFHSAHSNLLFLLQHHPGCRPEVLLREHIEWAKQHAEKFSTPIPPHRNDRNPDRPLRIGYVSPDFRKHVVASNLEPILANHDRKQFRIHAYSNVLQPDDVTARLQKLTDRWRSTLAMSDEQLAAQIREDKIDILVELAGHTAHNRLPVFARKPAPVQVSYLGYTCTTGLSTIDYRLTDGMGDPDGMTDPFYTETLIRVPGSVICYQPLAETSPTTALPADTNGHITFGSFNNLTKTTPDVVALWSRILQAVPNSTLRIKCKAFGDAFTRKLYQTMFQHHGIDASRLTLVAWETSIRQHIEAYRHVDIALDPFPFNGGITSFEALWSGVPIITMEGDSFVSRMGVRLLQGVNLQDLIARTPDDYIRIATTLANDLPRLRTLRQELNASMRKSPLMDGPQITRHIESAFRSMWKTWCGAPS